MGQREKISLNKIYLKYILRKHNSHGENNDEGGDDGGT